MKILVFADIHGNLSCAQKACEISRREQPQKVVFCGDLFGGWSNSESQIAQTVQSIDSVLYFVRGNNDFSSYDSLLGGMEENAVMYHFGRTLFFTHGHRYNAYRIPPILNTGDALIYGHTHINSLTKRNGLFCLNVGSLARPRDNVPSYLVLDESGATLKSPDGKIIYHLSWN